MKVVTGILGLIWKLYVGIVFVITAILMYPIIYPFLHSPRNKKKAFKLFVFWSWLFRILCFYHVQLEKKGTFVDGPMLIVANHASYLDIFLLYSIVPQKAFLFLGKSEILKYPLIKTYFKKLNIPVFRNDRRRAARSIINAMIEVRNDWSIVIFPEGGIPDENNPKMIRFKRGAFILAKQAQIPILPMTFINNYFLFSDPTKILGPARPGISKVVMHEPISLEKINELSDKELNDLCFKIINQPLLDRYPDLCE